MKIKPISQTTTIILVAIFLSVFHNVSYFRNIAEFYATSEQLSVILVSTGILHACILIILLSLTGFGKPLKAFLALVLIISSFIAYFSDTYNVIIDKEMLVNVAQTTPEETLDLLTLRMFAYFLFLGLLPALFVTKIQFLHEPIKKLILKRIGLVLGSIALLVILIFSNYDFFASFLREQKELRYYANPTKAIVSVFKLASTKFTNKNQLPWTTVADDAEKSEADSEYELVVLVIGETARAQNFSLNGYERKTNPKLENQNVISFQNVTSCGTTTAVSVPCMFSFQKRQNYEPDQSARMDNILDVLKRADVSVLWRDNNTGSKGVAHSVEYQPFNDPEVNPVCDIECRDEGMLSGLDEWINQHQGSDILIVLHQFGSHGPAYYKRYPHGFEKFKPTCQTNQLDQCSEQEIINTYDNTIFYTDYFLDKTINWLKTKEKIYEVSMLYISDHGESLGESGLYLHGFPYSLAPDQQTHVPAIFWTSQNNPDLDIDKTKINQSFQISHDNLSQTLMGLFEIKSHLYDPEKDFLKYHYRYD